MAEIRPEDIDPILEDILASIRIDWSELPGDITDILEEAAHEGAQETLARFGITSASNKDLFTRLSEQVTQWARERAAELVGKKLVDGRLIDNPDARWAIDDTTRDMLRDTVRQGLEEGWTASRFQTEIMESTAFSPTRALNIARTEASFARNMGSLHAAKASGVVTRKFWDADETACEEICQPNADQGSIGLDEMFDSGDEAPPGHPGCRCSLGWETEDATGEDDDGETDDTGEAESEASDASAASGESSEDETGE